MFLECPLPLSEVNVSTIHEIGFTIGYGLIAALGAYTAYHAKKAKDSGDQINDAVNHRHEKAGPDAPKLYDAVIHLHERTDHIDEKADELIQWKRGYDGGPLDHGEKVLDFVESVQDLKSKVDYLHSKCKGDCDGCDGELDSK